MDLTHNGNPSPTQTDVNSTTDTNTKKDAPPIAAIVGGVVGGVAFLALIGVGGCLIYRSGKKKGKHASVVAGDPGYSEKVGATLGSGISTGASSTPGSDMKATSYGWSQPTNHLATPPVFPSQAPTHQPWMYPEVSGSPSTVPSSFSPPFSATTAPTIVSQSTPPPASYVAPAVAPIAPIVNEEPPPMYNPAYHPSSTQAFSAPVTTPLETFAASHRELITADLETKLRTAGWSPTQDPNNISEDRWKIEFGVTFFELERLKEAFER